MQMKGQYRQALSLCHHRGGVKLNSTKVPNVLPNEVLVEVSMAAICLTDVYAATGVISCRDGVILGHEFVGRIVEVGEHITVNGVCGPKHGDRVAVMPYVPCGDCIDCNENHHWQCSKSNMLGIDVDGGFSNFVAVPYSQVYPIENQLSDKLNTFAEPVAAALSVLQSGIEPQQNIWVYGHGRIANLCAFVLREHGYKNITQGSQPPATSYDSLVLVQQPSEPLSYDAAANWLENLNVDGTVVIKLRTDACVNLPINLLIKKRLHIQAVNYAPIPQALAFIDTHSDFFARLAGPVYPLEQYQQAFAQSQQNKDQKVFLQI